MRRIDNEFVVWIDDDLFVDPGWLPPLIEKIDSDARIGAVTFKYEQGGTNHFNIGGMIKQIEGDHYITHPIHDENIALKDTLYFSGGATLLRRAAYNWSVPYDRMVDQSEDIYCSLHFLRDGWRIVAEPKSTGRHLPNRHEKKYYSERKTGGDYLRASADQIKKEFGMNIIRNNDWAYSAGARVLLIFPPPPAPGSTPFGQPPAMFPHGLGYVGAALAAKRQRVKLIDYRVEKPDIKQVINEFDPDWIGVYTTTVGWSQTERFIRGLRTFTRSPIVAGGPHASLFPETITEETADHVICGEGEVAFFDLIDKIENNARIIQAPRINDLNNLPFPDFAEFAKKNYARTDNEGFGLTDMASMNTSRGCPFNCRFCSGRKILGNRYTAMKPDKVAEGAAQLKTLGYKSIYFREDNFTANPQRAIDIASVIGRLGLRWAAESRVDSLDSGAIAHMARMGCAGFYIGIESGSQRVLDAMHKKIDVEQTEQFFGWCHKHGIKTYASIIIGYPGETDDDRQQTDALLERIQPDKICRNQFIGMPGSDIAADMLATGEYEKNVDGIIVPIGEKTKAG
jgi:radical SAM superfamily enzyme YgiQ (UPF0313 family)